jgi:hypothetical protein
MRRIAPFLLGCLLTGCGFNGCQSKQAVDLPDSVAELRDVAAKCRDEAKEARAAKEYDKAASAAKRAEAAVEKAATLLKKDATEADRAANTHAAAAAREARHFAKLADEDQRLANMLNSWKGTAYRSGRGLAFTGACSGLAQAADQAAVTDPKDLPESVRESAKTAAELARQHTGRKPLENGQPDWPGVAADLRRFGAKPPPEMDMMLSIIFLLSKKNDFALYEIERVEPSTITSERKLPYHILRGFVYSFNGLPLLAREEINKAGKIDPFWGPETIAGVHLLLAYLHLDAKEYEDADREIVRAMRAWPNNPVAVYLTGERQAATGEYEKAAASFEDAARGTDAEWMAKRLGQRARDVRDHPGKSDTLLHDHAFICEIFVHYLGVAAKNSEAARNANDAINSVREFSVKVVQNLPGQ